jgi:hypothetical protein
MFRRILIKEWRDNRLLLSLTGLALAVLVALGLAGKSKTAVYVAGALFFGFLAVGLLLGSAAFSSEYRDNAWSYLFSRPVRKSTIWIYKYLALLSFLAAGFLILSLAVALLPGLKSVVKDFYAPSFLSSTALYALAVFISLTIPYSLSILSEKTVVILAVSVFVAAFLFWFHFQSLHFFWQRYPYWGSFAPMGLFVGASFILASILTLGKIDFTRQARKLFVFSGLLLSFLALSLAAEILIISRGKPFSKPRIWGWYSSKIDGQVYLTTAADRIIRYDSRKNKVQSLPSSFGDALSDFSFAGGKIGFIRAGRTWTGDRRSEACVSNPDGTDLTILARFYGEDSELKGWTPAGKVLLSPGGQQAAFVAEPTDRRRSPVLFWMNVDATHRMSLPLESYYQGSVDPLCWLEKENSLVLFFGRRYWNTRGVTPRVVKVDLDTGAGTSFELNSTAPSRYWMVTYRADPSVSKAILLYQEDDSELIRLVLLDLETFKTNVIYEQPRLHAYPWVWAPGGDKFAFCNEGTMWVYSQSENRLRNVLRLPAKNGRPFFDWLDEGRRLAIVQIAQGGYELLVLGDEYKVEKKLRIPDRVARGVDYWNIWGLDEKILLASEQTGLWRLDLKTEEWEKVY